MRSLPIQIFTGAFEVLIAVKSCEKHWDRCSAIRDTWWTEQVMFFTGNMLNVHDSYEALPAKTQAICRWAVARGHLWAYLCDTDTYVHVPRLKALPLTDYMGYHLEGKDYASGGAGYILSRKAMEIIAKADIKDFTAEDEMVGKVLLGKVRLCHEPRFSLYEDVLPGNDIISRHLSSRKVFEIGMMYEAHRKAIA